MSVAQDPLHGVAGFFGVSFFDGASDGGMVGKVAIELAIDAVDGNQKHRAQNCVDRAAKALQHRIVRSVKNSEVKRLVRGSCGGLSV